MTANTTENQVQICEYSSLEGQIKVAYEIWDAMMDKGLVTGDDDYFSNLIIELEGKLENCPKPSDRKSKKSAEVELPEAEDVKPTGETKEMSAKELRAALTTFRDNAQVSLKCVLGGKGYSFDSMATEHLRVTGIAVVKAMTKAQKEKAAKEARPIAPTVAPNGKTVEFSGIELKKAIQPYGVAHKLNVKVTASFDDLAAEFLRITGTQVTKKATKAELKAATKKVETNKKEKQVTEKIANGTFYTAIVKGKQLAVEVVNSKGANFVVRELNKDGTSNPNGKLRTVARDRVFKLSTIEKLQAA